MTSQPGAYSSRLAKSGADAAERRNARAVQMVLECWRWLDEDVIALESAVRARNLAQLEYFLTRAVHSETLLQMIPADIRGDTATVASLSRLCQSLARRVEELEKAR